jgi:acetyl-CoA acetyltransferase
MKDVYVIGSYSTQFKRWPEKSIKDLVRMAYAGTLEDSGIDAKEIGFAWFSNCGWGHSLPPSEKGPGERGQMNVRGQAALAPLVKEGLFPRRSPIISVEGACASGSLAFHGACKDILSGQHDVSLALGVEKTFFPEHLATVIEMFYGGTDTARINELFKLHSDLGKETGKEWATSPSHSLFMDIYANMAAWHMKKYGTTQEQLAIAASKNHMHGSLNPLAQYQFEVPVKKVMADYMVSWPLTRSMCSPLGDGAAAAIVCTGSFLKKLPESIKRRAVRVLACTPATGYEHDISEPSTSNWAALRAYKDAGRQPSDIDIAEVHDATAFAEVHQLEQLGFCPIGDGGRLTESGATRFDGKKPVNTSGGLESKGHPIGATGLSQINEVVTQLRGEAGKRQVKNPRTGLVENGGGIVGFEEFACVITILGTK